MELRPDNRLFVALELPAPLRARLGRRARALAAALGGRAVGEERLHLTLHFLGRVPAGCGAALAGAVRAALPGPPVRLTYGGGLRALPRPARARLVAAELGDPDGGLAALHQRLGAALAEVLGRLPEKRPLWPHVTLVRFRTPAAADAAALARVPAGADADAEHVFAVSRCALYDSRQIAGAPPRYVAVAGGCLGPVS